jgi:hypothetical protein
MRIWGTSAVAFVTCLVLAAPPAGAASCRVKKNQDCFDPPAVINFSAVPEISRRIISEEPAGTTPKSSVVEAPPITTYTGPMVGVSSMAHAPTVGYYWSLEPEANK